MLDLRCLIIARTKIWKVVKIISWDDRGVGEANLAGEIVVANKLLTLDATIVLTLPERY